MARAQGSGWLNGPGLQPLLNTEDFGAWEALISRSLGHHRSRLQPSGVPFSAQISGSQLDAFQILALRGSGELELQREQLGHGVLWLPTQGLSQETVNGQPYLAEPGMAMLFQPGDVMHGLTSERIEGVSIVIPEQLLNGRRGESPLIGQGQANRSLINAAWQLVEAASRQQRGAGLAATAFVNALHQWQRPLAGPGQPERLTARRRRELVSDGCQWMAQHLAERFSVVELSQALQVSVRTLQYGFQAELGCTPMAQAKRQRLRHLRQLLQDPALSARSIAELMEACGLLACGVTAAEYRHWCGESPRRTRQRRR